MGHYLRILSPSERVPSIARVKASLGHAKLSGILIIESGSEDDWIQVSLSHEEGAAIANIERDSALKTDLVSREIAGFLEEIVECKPSTSVAWLAEFLPTVKTIFAFQILNGTNFEDGWEIFGKVKDSIFNQVGGIIQADGEGFSNEKGFHILWQFSNSAKGPWWMGLLQDNEWIHFKMDLGNRKHRAAFCQQGP